MAQRGRWFHQATTTKPSKLHRPSAYHLADRRVIPPCHACRTVLPLPIYKHSTPISHHLRGLSSTLQLRPNSMTITRSQTRSQTRFPTRFPTSSCGSATNSRLFWGSKADRRQVRAISTGSQLAFNQLSTGLGHAHDTQTQVCVQVRDLVCDWIA